VWVGSSVFLNECCVGCFVELILIQRNNLRWLFRWINAALIQRKKQRNTNSTKQPALVVSLNLCNTYSKKNLRWLLCWFSATLIQRNNLRWLSRWISAKLIQRNNLHWLFRWISVALFGSFVRRRPWRQPAFPYHSFVNLLPNSFEQRIIHLLTYCPIHLSRQLNTILFTIHSALTLVLCKRGQIQKATSNISVYVLSHKPISSSNPCIWQFSFFPIWPLISSGPYIQYMGRLLNPSLLVFIRKV